MSCCETINERHVALGRMTCVEIGATELMLSIGCWR